MLSNIFVFLTSNDSTFKDLPKSGINDWDIFTNPEWGDWYTTLFVKILLPIVLTLIFTIIVGYERQNMGKAAGLTSHTFVGLGSVCISIVQRLMYEYAIINHQNPIQGQRIVAQVVTGIGFLGAGVIMKDKFSVKGLTTAATIWVTAILGIIFGLGYIITGIILAVLIIAFILIRDLRRGINPFEKKKTKKLPKINNNIEGVLLVDKNNKDDIIVDSDSKIRSNDNTDNIDKDKKV